MATSFEQGWAARTFKEQFPELSDSDASLLDRLNMSITDMLLTDLLTDAQAASIRTKKFPRVVGRLVRAARAPETKQ